MLQTDADEWEQFTVHDHAIEALRSCSDLMALMKDQMELDLLDPRADKLIEPVDSRLRSMGPRKR